MKLEDFLELLDSLFGMLLGEVHPPQTEPHGRGRFGAGGIAKGGFGALEEAVGILDEGQPLEHGVAVAVEERVGDLVFAVHGLGEVDAAHVLGDEAFDAVELAPVELGLTECPCGVGERVGLHDLVRGEEFGVEEAFPGLAEIALAFEFERLLEDFPGLRVVFRPERSFLFGFFRLKFGVTDRVGGEFRFGIPVGFHDERFRRGFHRGGFRFAGLILRPKHGRTEAAAERQGKGQARGFGTKRHFGSSFKGERTRVRTR